MAGWPGAAPACRSNAQRRCDPSAALPDELLVEVFSKLPKQTAELLGGAVSLETRGSVERACRRWRRLALGLPATLRIKFCELHDQGLDYRSAEAEFAGLLPHIAARTIEACALQGCTEAVAPALPAQLARAAFPRATK